MPTYVDPLPYLQILQSPLDTTITVVQKNMPVSYTHLDVYKRQHNHTVISK